MSGTSRSCAGGWAGSEGPGGVEREVPRLRWRERISADFVAVRPPAIATAPPPHERSSWGPRSAGRCGRGFDCRQPGVPGTRCLCSGVEAGVPGTRCLCSGVEAGVPGTRCLRSGVERMPALLGASPSCREPHRQLYFANSVLDLSIWKLHKGGEIRNYLPDGQVKSGRSGFDGQAARRVRCIAFPPIAKIKHAAPDRGRGCVWGRYERPFGSAGFRTNSATPVSCRREMRSGK